VASASALSAAALDAAANANTSVWGVRQYADEFANDRSEFLVISETSPSMEILRGDASAGSPPHWLGQACVSSVCGESSLLNIAVHPKARRRGYGALLVLSALAAAHRTQQESFFLEVRSRNVAAVALYAACALEQVGRRPRYYQSPRDDALLWSFRFTDQDALAVLAEIIERNPHRDLINAYAELRHGACLTQESGSVGMDVICDQLVGEMRL